jgi:hypothetical protein
VGLLRGALFLPAHFHLLTGAQFMVELADRLAVNGNLPVTQNGFEDIAAFMGKKTQQTGKEGVVFFDGKSVGCYFFLARSGAIPGVFHVFLRNLKLAEALFSIYYPTFFHLSSP